MQSISEPQLSLYMLSIHSLIRWLFSRTTIYINSSFHLSIYTYSSWPSNCLFVCRLVHVYRIMVVWLVSFAEFFALNAPFCKNSKLFCYTYMKSSKSLKNPTFSSFLWTMKAIWIFIFKIPKNYIGVKFIPVDLWWSWLLYFKFRYFTFDDNFVNNSLTYQCIHFLLGKNLYSI